MRWLILIFFLPLHVFAQELLEVRDFGPNPGNLSMFSYTPARVVARPRLVVVLHGCLQTGHEFVRASGILALAAREGAHLLVPQQSTQNNGTRCFNWFLPEDVQRDQGEVGSIKAMVDFTIAHTGIAKQDIAVVGFSAGAGMANALLAVYPETFPRGILAAGVPYGCASSAINSLGCMLATAPAQTPRERGDHVRRASGNYAGPWPKVLILHGTGDEIVNYKNAQLLVDQWTDVHQISSTPAEAKDLESYRERSFADRLGVVRVKEISIPHLKHGFPVDPAAGCGATQLFLIDVKLCGAQVLWKFLRE